MKGEITTHYFSFYASMKKIILILCFLSVIIITKRTFGQSYGSWMSADSLKVSSSYAASVKLSNGNIMITGGEDSVAIRDAEIYDYQKGTWSFTNPMVLGRAFHLLINLNSSQVLAVSGGYQSRSCEIYDVISKKWTLTDSLNYERTFGETATLLDNGDVLVAGGYYLYPGDSRILKSCEIYDSKTSKWIITDSLKIDREYHTATKLQDGRILVAGGFSATQKELNDCEIYDPQTNKWTVVAPLNIARYHHSAVLLPDGNVLVTGGKNSQYPTDPWLNSCELYDPNNNSWTIKKSLKVSRADHSQIILNNGLLLIAGGGMNNNTWELYNPVSFSNIYLGDYPDTQAVPLVNLLPNGNVLAAGGLTWENLDGLPFIFPSKKCNIYKPGSISDIESQGNTLVKDFILYQNYPNPFNPETIIRYQLTKSGPVSIKIFDIMGKEIMTLVNEEKSRGQYEIKLDASRLASGIYFYRITANGFNAIKKMILMK